MASKKRNTIRRSTREIIYQVYKRCLSELETGNILTDINDVFKRTAEMTGTSERTVRRIQKEGHTNKGVFSTPGKHRSGRPRKLMDDFNMCAIRQTVQFFYTVMKTAPTLRNLLQVIREELGFDGGQENLRKNLQALGFMYKKCQSDKSVLMEKPNIAAKREFYLDQIIKNRALPDELKKEIIYLGECYVHTSYKLKKCWQSIDVSGIKESKSKGKRYIVINAGNEKGFVPNTLLIFSNTNKFRDYHSNMSRNDFRKWVSEKLIPNLPEAAIIVMDNAPYHSVILNKVPSSDSRVEEIKLWLTENNIPFETTARKPQLLLLVKRHKPEPVYEIDELLSQHGHTVLRLPPQHCDLNPIELIWRIAKQKIASNVGSVDIKEAAAQAFASISVEEWRNSCDHVMKIEKEYYERGQMLYEDIDRIVTNLQDDSSSMSDSSDESMAESFREGSSPAMEDDDLSCVEFLEVE